MEYHVKLSFSCNGKVNVKIEHFAVFLTASPMLLRDFVPRRNCSAIAKSRRFADLAPASPMLLRDFVPRRNCSAIAKSRRFADLAPASPCSVFAPVGISQDSLTLALSFLCSIILRRLSIAPPKNVKIEHFAVFLTASPCSVCFIVISFKIVNTKRIIQHAIDCSQYLIINIY